MPAIGIALLWTAYYGGLWGYCLIRGYNLTPRQLLSTTWPPAPVTGPAQQLGENAFNAFQNTPHGPSTSSSTTTPGVPPSRGPF